MRRVCALLVVAQLLGQSDPAQARRRGRPVGGALSIKSSTTGAEVQVDERVLGHIPLPRPIPLRPGKHTLKLARGGYTGYLDVFTIKPGKVTTLEIDLLPVASVLAVTASVEGARVFIDGEFVGTTPLEREVPTGKRALVVRKPGYYDHIGTVGSVAGKRQRIRVQLRPMPVGSSPYRPPPARTQAWYEKWYVWVGGAAAVAAITTAIVVPVVLMQRDEFAEFCGGADLCVRR